ENPLGGAPGFQLGNTWVLPGLPREMEAMFDAYADELRGERPIGVWRRLLRTRESTIAPALEEATRRWPAVSVGSYPSFHPARSSAGGRRWTTTRSRASTASSCTRSTTTT